MKRFYVVVLSALAIFLCIFSGCSAAPQYEALEVGSYDSSDGGMHASEFPLWDSSLRNYHQDNSAPNTATVTFNGKSYTGEYSRSAVCAPATYKSHVYKGSGFKFEINASTGELTDILFYNTDTLTPKYDQAACKQIADAIVVEYIDINDFQVEVKVHDDSYTFDYCRMVNGYRTTDELVITINCEGNVSSFGYFTLNDFEICNSASVDANKAEQVVFEKLDSIYPANAKRTGSEIQSVVLVKMEDGSIAFYYTMSNSFRDGNMEYGSLVNILVKRK